MRLTGFFFILLILGVMPVFLWACDDDDDDDDNDDNNDESTDDDDSDSPGDDDDDDDDDNNDDNDDDDDDTDGQKVYTDTTTGLMWQDGNINTETWADAVTYCDTLTWAGYNDWHLPTIGELRSLIRGCAETAPGGSCGVTDDCLVYDDCFSTDCWACDSGAGPADGKYWPDGLVGTGGWTWSSSELTDFPGYSWAIPFFDGDIDGYDQALANFVRCVRQG